MHSNQIRRTFEAMPAVILHHRLVIALLSALLLLLSSCKKTIEQISQGTVQEYFEQNILNKEFVVELAKDGDLNKTADFEGYKFILTKTTSFYDGPMTGTKDGTTYSGTWTSNEDYGKLVIQLNSPAPPASFSFINRSWRFTRKSLPIMELAPWGSTAPLILHMRRL